MIPAAISLAARARRLVAEPQARCPGEVRRFEVETQGRGEIEARHAGIDPFGPSEGMGDGYPHVGGPELRENRSVLVFDHRVDDALRVDHDLHPVRRRIEEPARLDDLERLVHHRGRVHRDLGTHFPDRMRAGRLGGDEFEMLRVPAAKRPAGRGQQDPPHPRPSGPRRQALEHGVVLAVDGDELRAGRAHRVDEETPGHDERLLVRKEYPLAGAGGGQGRKEPRGADDPGHHVADLRQGGHLFERRGPGQDAGSGAGEPAAQLRGGRFVHEHRELGAMAADLRFHRLDVGVRGERRHPKTVRVDRGHFQGVGPDGPRRTEHGDAGGTHLIRPWRPRRPVRRR